MIRDELKRGIMVQNPIFGLALGLCPALAITTTAFNALGMGIAVIFVLTCSNVTVSLIRRWIPEKVRIPCYITIIATFVTIADLFMKAYAPFLSSQLGIYVPLIAANCLILARAEAYASKSNLVRAAVDGIVMGFGFSLSLVLISAVREILGYNKLFGVTVITGFHPMVLFVMPAGGFFVVAAFFGIVNYRRIKKARGNP
jgi:electron transport complex protein RnfE